MISTQLRPFAPLLLLMVACSGESTDEKSEAATGEWTVLAEESWTLEPGTEAEDWCAKVPIEEDIYVSAIRPIHPKGTHHTFVSLSDTAEGESCTSSVGRGGLVYAAGLGSEGLTLPEGVAVKLPAGKILNLSLHLYNPGDETLSGTSGMEIIRMDPADVVAESEIMLAGPISISIPPGRHTLTHECAITDEQTAYALFPHMHQLGAHFKTTVTVDGVPKVLHDASYDFTEQEQKPLDLLKLSPGDTVSTECTYENPGASTVTFGESSDTEMCFSVFFRFPKTGSTFCGLPGSSSAASTAL